MEYGRTSRDSAKKLSLAGRGSAIQTTAVVAGERQAWGKL
jgi:hypothetical protein